MALICFMWLVCFFFFLFFSFFPLFSLFFIRGLDVVGNIRSSIVERVERSQSVKTDVIATALDGVFGSSVRA